MNRNSILFFMLITLSLLVSCDQTETNRSSDLESLYSVEYNRLAEEFNKVDVFEIEEKLNTNKNFFLYVGRQSCPYCQIFIPKLHLAVNERQIKLYYLDVEDARYHNETSLFLESSNIQYIPSLIYFTGGNKQIQLEIDSTNITVEEITEFFSLYDS